jgi:hypothetical protein
MAFSGVDSIVSAKTAGQRALSPFNRTVVTGATSAAGRWHEMLSGGGTGGPMTLTGAAGVGIVCNSATAGGIPIGANVSPNNRHLQELLGLTGGATIAPGLVLLSDIIHIYPSCVLTGAPTALSNHPSWTGTGDTRMTNARGVMCSLVVTTAGTAGNGSITPTYVDQDANAAQASPRALQAPVATAPAGCLYGDTGVAVTVGGPYMPLAATDTGVRQISSYAINTGLTTGVGAFVLHRPIALIPLVAANIAGAREWILGERIFDDACLGMFAQIGGAATTGQTISGHLDTVWG